MEQQLALAQQAAGPSEIERTRLWQAQLVRTPNAPLGVSISHLS
jgi:hypothetical protein